MSNPAQSALDSAAFAHPHSGSMTLSRFWRALVFPAKLFWGLMFCQSFIGSLMVIGWTYRLAQRSVLKYWWLRGPGSRGAGIQDFNSFLSADEITKPHLHWPNWFCRQNLTLRRPGGVSLTHHLASTLKALVHSLVLNFRLGLTIAANTSLLVLPACLFWWFGWYDGWNNSFNKGYEQAVVGPLISIFGIFWFITAMFYVPLAQARQGVTGEWRSFYRFRLIWQIVRLRWLSCVLLAVLYFVLAIPLTVLKTSPMFWMQNHPEMASAPDAQLIKSLNGFFFWCGLVLFPGYVALRVYAARIYASGILYLVQTGKVPSSMLEESERCILQRLDLLTVRAQPERHFLVRFITWTGTRLGRIVGGVALTLIWFGFVAQIYIAEFFNYHGAFAWLNQPLVQLPWFHYLPARLKNPFEEIFTGALAVFLILLVSGTVRAFRRVKSNE